MSQIDSLKARGIEHATSMEQIRETLSKQQTLSFAPQYPGNDDSGDFDFRAAYLARQLNLFPEPMTEASGTLDVSPGLGHLGTRPILIGVHAVIATDDDGAHASTVTPAYITSLIARCNQIYAPAGIQFRFDETLDVERVRSTLLNQ